MFDADREAHKGSDEVLEAVRLLNNLELGAHKLVQIILLGQDELLKRLSTPALSSFHQRIAALEVIGKMDAGQVRAYILHRLEVAGGRYQVFTDEAIEAIASSTGGIPRVTNSLCDRALMATFGHGGKRVDIEDVREAGQAPGGCRCRQETSTSWNERAAHHRSHDPHRLRYRRTRFLWNRRLPG